MEQKIREFVEKARKDKEVIAVILFGSYLKNREYARDIDLCLVLDEGKKIKNPLKKRLRYLSHSPDKFDVQIFQLLPLNVRISILKEGKILYSTDMNKIYELAYRTIKEYSLFENYYKDYINSVIK